MSFDAAAAAAEAARRRAEEARRRAEEARRKAEAAAKKAAEAAARKAEAAAAKKVELKPRVREKPSTRFEALRREPTRRESRSTSFQALRTGPTRRESRSTRFEAIKVDRKNDARVSKAAEARYDELQKEAGTKKVLEQLGVESARDFQKLGNQYAKQLHGEGEAIDVSKVQSRRDLSRVLRATADTQSGADAELMAKPTVATLVAHGQSPEKAAAQAPMLDALDLSDENLTAIAEKAGPEHIGEAAQALATLGDEDASIADKTAAAIQLGDDATKYVPDDVLEGVLGKAFKGLPDAKATVEAIGTLTDSDASAEEKAKAGFDLANQLKDLAGAKPLAKLGAKLQRLDGPLKAAGAIMTLADGEASLKDKAIAAAELGSTLPEIKGSLKALRDFFTKQGVEGVDDIVKQGDELSKLLDRGVDLSKVRAMAPAKLEALTGLAGKIDGEGLGRLVEGIGDEKQLDQLVKRLNAMPAEEASRAVNALGTLDPRQLARPLSDPKALTQLLDVTSKLDADAAKNFGTTLRRIDPKGVDAFLKVAQQMDAGTLSDVMHGAEDAQRFAATVTKLDAKNLDAFAKAAGEMDAGALKLVGKLGASASASAVNGFVPALAKVAGNDLVGKALGAFDELLGVMKVDLNADLAGKALKGLGKLLPGVSAGVSGVSAVKFGVDAAKLQGKQDDLAFLAHTGVKLNALDAALEFIPGVGTLAGIGTGVAALALDLGFSAEKAKYEANPEGYEAPGWVKAVNIGVAVIGPPPGAGIPELVATYGVKDAAELGLWAVSQGGKLATAAWDVLKKLGGPAVEIALEAVDKLKDLGAAGAEALEYIAKAPGELGEAVAEKAVEGLKALGEAGVEALKNVASSGAAVAKKAAEGLKSLADAGIGAAEDALGALKDVGGEIGDFVGGLVPDIDLPGPL